MELNRCLTRRRALATAFTAVLALPMVIGAAFAGGCGPSTKPLPVQHQVRPDAAPPAAPSGRITFDCEPAEAQVVVDGSSLGTAAELVERGGAQLPMGHHRIEIKLDGYRTFRFELILGERTETIKVRLQRVDSP